MNMTEVGRKIAALRRQKDMTQLELADKMGISFQAVSNWERGLSMPDIGKLPELAALFEVSIGELLGEEATPVVKVMESHEAATVTPKELVDAAPLLKPSQVDTLAAQLPVTDLEEIAPLLPFVGTELVDEWGEEAAKGKQLGTLNELVPFMSDKGLERCVRILHEMGEDAVILYPFMGRRQRQSAYMRSRVQRGSLPLHPLCVATVLESWRAGHMRSKVWSTWTGFFHFYSAMI